MSCPAAKRPARSSPTRSAWTAIGAVLHRHRHDRLQRRQGRPGRGSRRRSDLCGGRLRCGRLSAPRQPVRHADPRRGQLCYPRGPAAERRRRRLLPHDPPALRPLVVMDRRPWRPTGGLGWAKEIAAGGAHGLPGFNTALVAKSTDDVFSNSSTPQRTSSTSAWRP